MSRLVQASVLSAAVFLFLPLACEYVPPEINDGGNVGGNSNTTSSSASSSSSDIGASSSSSSSSGNGAGIVHCGTSDCPLGSVCCTNQSQDPQNLTTKCALLGSCSLLTIPCDGPEDCLVGQYCCGVWREELWQYESVGCDKTCDMPNLIICKFGAPDPGCPMGLTCKEEFLFGPGYGYCG